MHLFLAFVTMFLFRVMSEKCFSAKHPIKVSYPGVSTHLVLIFIRILTLYVIPVRVLHIQNEMNRKDCLRFAGKFQG